MWRRTRDNKLEIAAQVLSHSQDCEMPRESSGGCAKACWVESDWAQPPEDSLGTLCKSYICFSVHRQCLHSFNPSSYQVLEHYILLKAECLQQTVLIVQFNNICLSQSVIWESSERTLASFLPSISKFVTIPKATSGPPGAL